MKVYKDAYKIYKKWLESEYFDEKTKLELESIKDDKEEIEERFYRDLEFGTGGIRGIIGAGTNRMNKYIIRKVCQGIADYIKAETSSIVSNATIDEASNASPATATFLNSDVNITSKAAGRIVDGIVIAYDSRHKSKEFSIEAAEVFAGNGIKVYLFDEIKPVPMLSFSIRHLRGIAGLVITASHNPKNYNGCKVYGEDGAQLSPEESDKVIASVKNIKNFSQIKRMNKEEAREKGLLVSIGKEIDDAYMKTIKTYTLNPKLIKENGDSLKIIYTPLNGSGNKPVRRILDEVGFKNVVVVKEQENPDPDFSTLITPNPEDEKAFELAIKTAQKEDGDLIIGTDPDSDRIGIMIKDSGKDKGYLFLSGNEIGCLMLEYILTQKKLKRDLPDNGFIITTIVSTRFANIIAKRYNILVEEVFTGFKFIAEKIKEKELSELEDKEFLFGFEESYGYLIGTYARDKDAVSASMLIAEMVLYYKTKGLTLKDRLTELYEKYGYIDGGSFSFTLEGKEGLEKISHGMKELREKKDWEVPGYKILSKKDYLLGEEYNFSSNIRQKLSLSGSNVLCYELEKGDWFCIRPSGTEPKIKIYFESSGSCMKEAKEKARHLKDSIYKISETVFNENQ